MVYLFLLRYPVCYSLLSLISSLLLQTGGGSVPGTARDILNSFSRQGNSTALPL